MAATRRPVTKDAARGGFEDLPKGHLRWAGFRRWALAISGLVSVIVGVLVLTYPGPSVKLLGVFLGIEVVAGGALLLVRGGSDEADSVEGPAQLMLGVLIVMAGIGVILNPDQSLRLLTVVFAIYLIVSGALSLGHGLISGEGRWAAFGRGVVLVAAGTTILAWPNISARTLTILAGIALVVQGGLAVAEAFALKPRHWGATER